MKIDLQNARVRPVGSSGIAHRTSAGFVMLGTADSRNVLSIIEENSAQSNVVELVIAELSVAAPEAFCFLFVSQGELFVLTCGSAVISLTTSTGQTRIEPQPHQVLIQRIDLGVGDSDGRLVLYQRGMTVDQVDGLDSVVDLQSGTVLADALDLTVRRETGAAMSAPAAPAAIHLPAEPVPAPGDDNPQAAPADIPMSRPAAEPEVVAAPVVLTPIALDEPLSMSSMPPPPPPTADQIMFAEDIDEISGAVDEVSLAGPGDQPAIIDDVAATPSPAVAPMSSFLSTERADAVPSVPPSLAPSVGNGAFSEVLDGDKVAISADADPGPAPVAAPVTAAPVGPVMVLGVACPDGHHNHPDATECSECAARIGEHHTTVLMNGPRPSLGMLMVDDGKTWSLASDIIIGREPATHADVAAGSAVSMALTDDTLSLSRHHARVSLDDWSALVIDLGSSNGTYLNRNRSAQEWSPVPTDMALELEPGDRLRVGGRIIQVELYQFEG